MPRGQDLGAADQGIHETIGFSLVRGGHTLFCCCHADAADLVWCVGACITQSMLIQTVLQFITIAVVMPPTLVVLIVAGFFFYQTQKYYRPASRDMQVWHVTRRVAALTRVLTPSTKRIASPARGDHRPLTAVHAPERDDDWRGEHSCVRR